MEDAVVGERVLLSPLPCSEDDVEVAMFQSNGDGPE